MNLAINKERKNELVEQYKELLKNSNGMVITSYSGVPVKELESLRKKVREMGGEFHIVKNTLMELALKDAGLTIPAPILEGTTAVGFAVEDVPGMAKVIMDIARESGTMSIKGGVIDRTVYDSAQVQRIADLPPLPVVQAQLLSMIQTPASRVAAILSGSIRQLVSVTKAYADSGTA
jgi:large subunit ribosomal protein L10